MLPDPLPDTSGRLWAFCPAHPDGQKKRRRSLSLDNRGLKCWAGCEFREIVVRLERMAGGTGQSASSPDIRRRTGEPSVVTRPANHHRDLVQQPQQHVVLQQVWQYGDETGEIIAEHGRFVDGQSQKTYKWRLAGGRWEDGLKGKPVSALPLYNLHLLRQHAGEPVFLVEGEKAADACTSRGMVAVSLAGGASQKDFGEALEPLRDRDILLWPDNDSQGRGLMQRVSAVLPGASFLVLPGLPEKGDAVDYFEQGGTVADLLSRTAKPQSVATVNDDCVHVVVPYPGGEAVFDFTGIEVGRHKLEAEIEIGLNVAGYTQERFSGRCNLLSLSSREAVRRHLDEMFGKDIGWTALLNKACQMARLEYLAAPVSVDISEVDLSLAPAQRFRIDRFLVEGGLNTIFGMGDAGKGHLVVHLGVCIAYGIPFLERGCIAGNVMYIDYEDCAEEWALRVVRHCQGLLLEPPFGLFSYYAGRGIPLPDQVPAIRRECARRNVSVVMVDSAVTACGGNPNDADVTGRFANALKAIGPTPVLIAHNNKGEDDRYPLGSIMWHNLSRVSWFVKRAEDDDKTAMTVGLFHRKRNRMRPEPPFGIRIDFNERDEMTPEQQAQCPITITNAVVSDAADLTKHFSQERQTVLLLSRSGGRTLTPGEIGAEIGVPVNHVATILGRLQTKGQVTVVGRRLNKTSNRWEQEWGLQERWS